MKPLNMPKPLSSMKRKQSKMKLISEIMELVRFIIGLFGLAILFTIAIIPLAVLEIWDLMHKAYKTRRNKPC